ncbi:MAG TPA: YlbF family regulator [Clostridia bacterium]|nr:YlbF family regulator [Clostridia bacterium]
MSTVLSKARELGSALANCEELKAMHEAEVNMVNSGEARELITEFNEKQRTFQMIQSSGGQLTDGQKAEVSALEEKMLSNSLIVDFFKAQQNFEKILEELNKIIEESISRTGGSEGCSSCNTSGCDGCSQC